MGRTSGTLSERPPTTKEEIGPALAVRNVTVRFGGIVALSEVSLDVARTSVTGIVGPNGAGKTTLFAVMSGLRRPAGGVVEFDGTDVSRIGAHRRARRGLARTFQRVELFPSLSVRDHLMLAEQLAGNHHKKRMSQWEDRPLLVDELLESLGLADVADLEAATLPLGTARLVEVGRALATHPLVLLLDEPFSGLDSSQRQHLRSALLTCQERLRTALVLVEHDVDLVLGMTDYIYVLDMGRLISQGPPDEVVHDPAVRSAYLGSDFQAGDGTDDQVR